MATGESVIISQPGDIEMEALTGKKHVFLVKALAITGILAKS